MSNKVVDVSKFLSLVLRHQPEKIGLVLDDQGWADVEELLLCLKAAKKNVSRELLEEVVRDNNKQRFAFSEDGTQIRANQGHSIEVDLALPPQPPPELLYHGTAVRNLPSIAQDGLVRGRRQHVHLSLDVATATNVGARHGKPHVLTVRAGEMFRDGRLFYCSDNGVWLTESVPTAYLDGL